MTNETTRLFGLAGVVVVSVAVGEDDIPTLALTTAAEQARCCPDCGVRSQRAHSWVRTRPRDLPVTGRRTALTWTKRRWRCLNAAYDRATFTESLPSIPFHDRVHAGCPDGATDGPDTGADQDGVEGWRVEDVAVADQELDPVDGAVEVH